MSVHGRFLLQVAATTAGTVLDIVVGRLTGKPTWVLAVWAIVALLVAAFFEFFKDTANDRYTIKGVRVSIRGVPGFFRPATDYRFGVIVKAAFSALFAGLAPTTIASNCLLIGTPLYLAQPKQAWTS